MKSLILIIIVYEEQKCSEGRYPNKPGRYVESRAEVSGCTRVYHNQAGPR